jgi:hypothetical protein
LIALALSMVIAAGASVTSNAVKMDAAQKTRDLAAVTAMRARIAAMLPDVLARDDAVTLLDKSAQTLNVRKTLLSVPIVVHHQQSKQMVTDTTVVLSYGPEEDEQYDSTGFGGKTYYEASSNPAGVKLNVSRKFVQACDLVAALEAAKKKGESLYQGIPVANLLPGLIDALALNVGHETMHVAQFMVHPAINVDENRAKIKDGKVPQSLIDGAKYERAYEQEAFTWQYGQTVGWKSELLAAADALDQLRSRDPQEFARGGKFEYLGSERNFEFAQHYMRDVVTASDQYVKGGAFKFVGIMHLLMDAMVDVPTIANALEDANNDAIDANPKKMATLRDVTAKAEKVRHVYFDQGPDTDAMLEARPFLKDVKPKLDREIDRANGRLMGR